MSPVSFPRCACVRLVFSDGEGVCSRERWREISRHREEGEKERKRRSSAHSLAQQRVQKLRGLSIPLAGKEHERERERGVFFDRRVPRRVSCGRDLGSWGRNVTALAELRRGCGCLRSHKILESERERER